MDAKELKSALKSAREAIRSKDYKEALKHCKAVLKADKNNYNALVFVAVAANELDTPEQSLAAYKRAIEVDSDNPLAWQGLCGFYEKHEKPEHAEELIQVYMKLLSLHDSDKPKKIEVGEKLGHMYVTRRRFLEALDVYDMILELLEQDTKRLDILHAKAKVFEKLDKPSELQKDKLLQICKELTDGSKADCNMWTTYITLLKEKCEDVEALVSAAERFSTQYPKESLPVEILTIILLDSSVEYPDKLKKDAPILLERLEPQSSYTLLLQGSLDTLDGKWPTAKTALKSGLDGVRTCISGWLYLAETLLKLHEKHQAYKTASQGLLQLNKVQKQFYGNEKAVKRRLLLCQAETLLAIGKASDLAKVQSLCNELSSMNTEQAKVDLLQAKIYISGGKYEEAIQVLTTTNFDDKLPEALVLIGWGNHKLGNLTIAEESLHKCLEIDPQSSRGYFYLGCILYESNVESSMRESLQMWLKSAKLDPYCSDVFYCLGKYYEHVAKDLQKGSRCYQKAYELDPDDTAGASFIDSLVALSKEDIALSFLRSATSSASAGSGKWAWLRLGLYQLKHNDTTSAIMSLQSALRADPNDVHCWECLGEAYMARGSYTAALKAFKQATDIDQSAMYCYYQMATIKQTLGLYDEAVGEYRGLLIKNPEYVPALKGLGETYLLMARVAIKEFFHGRAVDYSQLAISYLTKSASLRPDLSCQWKLLGDVCTLLAPVPQEKMNLALPAKLLGESENQTAENSVTKKEILSVGARCYGMAVKLKPDCAALWHDLGVNYFHQTKIADKVMEKLFANKSIQCLQKSVRLDPNNHTHWNALGVIASSPSVQDLSLAQHCFIKSIDTEPNNVKAWTNLGVLYLKESNVMLAHESFKVAQALEPSYVSCWIGQALVAETIANEEAMDLFRHTLGLGMHIEGAVGYAHWVCKLLQDENPKTKSIYEYAIEQMAAVPAASDALAKYTDRVKDDPVAYNLYGILLERQGLYKTAADAFHRAIILLEKSRDPVKIQSVCENYARSLLRVDAVEAVKQYKSQNLAHVGNSYGLALALSKANLFHDSYKVYEKTLQHAANESERSHIYAAMGIVAYRAGDQDLAKSALFAGSQSSSPSVIGLQVLLGIGLVHKDSTLVTAVLQEMKNLHNSKTKLIAWVDKMAAEMMATSSSVDIGSITLQKAAHMYPYSVHHWRELASFLLQHSSEISSSAALTCIQKTLDGTSSSALVLALSLLGAGKNNKCDSNNASRWAQKAVHMHPDKLDNWFVLLAALHGQQEISNSSATQSQVLVLATHLMAKVETQLSQTTGDKTRLQALHLWCVKHYILALMSAGRHKQAEHFLQQAGWLYDSDNHLQSLIAFFKQDFTTLKSLSPKDSTGYAYQLLVSLYLIHGLLQEAKNTHQKWFESAESKSQKLLSISKLAHFAYTNANNKKLEASDIDNWIGTLKQACTNGLEVDPTSSTLFLMQGIMSIDDKKLARLGKRSLHQVLDKKSEGDLPYAAHLAKERLLKAYKEKGDDEAVQQLLKQTENLHLDA